ncbi:DUF3703 domain-containing protein [Roseateles puraquae]|uniref:DUF3703 domain-containing protein n=1 Tax=Roseateles puraquae TaxID=431059 RepID=UPI0031D37816
MPSYGRAIGPFVDAELREAWRAVRRNEFAAGFRHLERAHVMGQASTYQHVRVHVHMLAWGLSTRSARQTAGQLLRIAGAATKTPFGLVPTGNTGGADISPFKPLPIPADLAKIIREARQATR